MNPIKKERGVKGSSPANEQEKRFALIIPF